MMCVGHYEITPPIYKKFVEKNKCLCTNGKLENGLRYLYYVFQLNVIDANYHLEMQTFSNSNTKSSYN